MTRTDFRFNRGKSPRFLANRMAPQIRDVEAARLARRHKTIPLQGVENGGATVGERCAEQVEIRRVVELKQDLLAPDALRRNTVFEVHLIEAGGL